MITANWGKMVERDSHFHHIFVKNNHAREVFIAMAIMEKFHHCTTYSTAISRIAAYKKRIKLQITIRKIINCLFSLLWGVLESEIRAEQHLLDGLDGERIYLTFIHEQE